MPLPITCACGARLEVDDKFAGQTIACPDCNRPLTAPLPPRPPTATSGLALASFLLALIGAFTIVGTIAAVICGFLALRQIGRSPLALGGGNLARAGVVLGCVFTLITLPLFIAMERAGLDGFLRGLEVAGQIDYDKEAALHWSPMVGTGFTIERPDLSWGSLKPSSTDTSDGRESRTELTLINVRDDAHIVCIVDSFDVKMPLDTCREEGLAMLQNSRLVKTLSRARRKDKSMPAGEIRDLKELGDREIQEFFLDTRLGGVERTFLVRVLRDDARVGVVAGGARKSRFEKLKQQIRDGVESFKLEKN